MSDLGQRLAAMVGLTDGQGYELAAYLATLGSAAEVRTHLGSLLPDTAAARKVIDEVARAAGRGSARPATPPAPASAPTPQAARPSSSGTRKANNASPAKPKSATPKAVARVPAKKLEVVRGTGGQGGLNHTGTNRGKLITGNEPGCDGTRFQNCIDCGMIYTADAYSRLSRCEFCEEPLGRAQLKKARAQDQADADAAMARALAHRDKLLEFDATSAARTQVFDDQSDYFEMDVSVLDSKWASEEERARTRQELEQQRDAAEAAASKTYLTFDLAGRRVVEDSALTGTANEVYARLSRALG